MSIIDEALKKAEKEKTGGAPFEEKRALKATAHIRYESKPEKAVTPSVNRYVIVGIVALIIIIAYYAVMSSGRTRAHSRHSVISKHSPAGSNTTADARPANVSAANPIRDVPGIFKLKPDFPDLALSGIMQLTDGPRAIINDVMVGVGDVVEGVIVKKISRDSVVLKNQDSEITLEMK